jgi:hypothetical protein
MILKYFVRAENRISGQATKKTEIRLATTYDKNEQQQDDKKYA